MPDNAIQLVVFDLGRVLIKLCDGWAHAAQFAGVTHVPLEVSELDDAARAEWDRLVGLYDSGRIDQATLARQIAKHRGIEPEDVIRLQNCFLQGAYPGAAELIHELCDAGISTAVLSNTAEPHWGQVFDPHDPNYLPMERLTYHFASHLLGLCKPSHEIYEHVERTSRVKPPSIVFFDDLEANVVGAARRGWRAVQIQIDADPIQQMREHLRALGVLKP